MNADNIDERVRMTEPPVLVPGTATGLQQSNGAPLSGEALEGGAVRGAQGALGGMRWTPPLPEVCATVRRLQSIMLPALVIDRVLEVTPMD